MPQFTQHAQGTFSWPELATTDQQGALAFYRALFGWGVNDQPIGPSEMYSLLQLNGNEVAAAYTMRDDEQKMGMQPHWNMYISVQNVDDATKRAQELGATVLVPPFDVMDAGRMSVLKDPSGAVFQLWQAGRSIGAKTLAEPGALCWTELMTDDTAKAEKFYTALLGWTPKHSSPAAPMPYTEFTVKGADRPSAGMLARLPHMPKEVPPFWMPYFMVADVDAAVGKAASLGGKAHVPAQDLPGTGRFAVLVDPQGAAFAVFAPARA